MDGHQAKQEDPPPLPPRLSLGGDRVKRDEWSEGAVECLLEAYESKWILRNRAKLKGQDWEDVAGVVSTRGAGSAKTATQCKNKIESMKKRYRNEVAAGSGSKWPLFAKMDGLVRCRGAAAAPGVPNATAAVDHEKPVASCEKQQQLFVAAAADHGDQASHSAEQNGSPMAAAVPPQENHEGGGERRQPTEAMNRYSDRNPPSCSSSKEKRETRRKEKRKRGTEEGWGIAESFQWLAKVILRVEQTRMEAMREVERMRAETEARNAELELKKTEIVANTQLQIAKLLAKKSDKS